MAARANGEGKNALAACDSWCSGKYISGVPSTPQARQRVLELRGSIHSLSFSHSGSAIMKGKQPARRDGEVRLQDAVRT